MLSKEKLLHLDLGAQAGSEPLQNPDPTPVPNNMMSNHVLYMMQRSITARLTVGILKFYTEKQCV
mgnify:CR=1 FL=1